MQFARTPVLHGSSLETLSPLKYTLEDVVVEKRAILFTPDSQEVVVAMPGIGPRTLRWGGDAHNHVIKDMRFAEREDDMQFLLRIKDGVIVGGLTTEYHPVNNADIISTLESLNLNVVNWRLSPSRSYFFATNGEQIMVGDEQYKTGVALVNSETGYKRLQIHSGLLRLVCVNGVFVALPGSDDLFDKLHLHTQLGTDFDISAKIEEMLAAASALVDRMEHTRTFGDTAEHVEEWLNLEFGKRQRTTILENMGLNPDNRLEGTIPRFELLNAVTQLHQTFPKSTDRWHQLGGRLLDETFLLDELDVEVEGATTPVTE